MGEINTLKMGFGGKIVFSYIENREIRIKLNKIKTKHRERPKRLTFQLLV